MISAGVGALRLVLAAAAAAVVAAAPAQAEPSTAERAAAHLARALNDLVAMDGGPVGAIALVQRGDDVEVYRAGVARLGTDARPDANNRMRLASVSKAFSGAAALALVEAGTLSLDDTIGERLPDLPSAWAPVTLRQLLGHTSGLPDFTQDADFQRAVGANLLDPPRPIRLVSYVRDAPLNFAPGTDYRYSNTDNVVVGLMIEAATGLAYERVLRDAVYTPLGLPKTGLPKGAELREPFIHGYDNDPEADPPEDLSEVLASGWVWASGGMVSSPADLNRFIRGYVSGELFGSAVRAAQRDVFPGGRSDPPGPGKNAAGLALFRYETACGTVWGHTGNYPGYTQFAAANSSGRRSVTVSVNEQLSPIAGAPGVFAALRDIEELAVCAALAD